MTTIKSGIVLRREANNMALQHGGEVEADGDGWREGEHRPSQR